MFSTLFQQRPTKNRVQQNKRIQQAQQLYQAQELNELLQQTSKKESILIEITNDPSTQQQASQWLSQKYQYQIRSIDRRLQSRISLSQISYPTPIQKVHNLCQNFLIQRQQFNQQQHLMYKLIPSFTYRQLAFRALDLLLRFCLMIYLAQEFFFSYIDNYKPRPYHFATHFAVHHPGEPSCFLQYINANITYYNHVECTYYETFGLSCHSQKNWPIPFHEQTISASCHLFIQTLHHYDQKFNKVFSALLSKQYYCLAQPSNQISQHDKFYLIVTFIVTKDIIVPLCTFLMRYRLAFLTLWFASLFIDVFYYRPNSYSSFQKIKKSQIVQRKKIYGDTILNKVSKLIDDIFTKDY